MNLNYTLAVLSGFAVPYSPKCSRCGSLRSKLSASLCLSCYRRKIPPPSILFKNTDKVIKKKREKVVVIKERNFHPLFVDPKIISFDDVDADYVLGLV